MLTIESKRSLLLIVDFQSGPVIHEAANNHGPAPKWLTVTR
jgi:hypothetical protein